MHSHALHIFQQVIWPILGCVYTESGTVRKPYRVVRQESHRITMTGSVVWHCDCVCAKSLEVLIGCHHVTQSAVAKTMSSSQSDPLHKSFLFVCLFYGIFLGVGVGQKGRK